MAQIAIDVGIARDTELMLTDVHAVLDGLACGDAPAAARQAAAILTGTDSPYTLQALTGAVSETISRLHRARRDALAGIPDQIPGT
jgi:hypothetical protein